MLLNYTPWGGLEAYGKGVPLTDFFWVKMGKKLRIYLECVNALSH